MTDEPGMIAPTPLACPEGYGDLDLNELVRDLNETAAKSVAPSTRTAYDSDWQRFERWCSSHHAAALPAHAALVALYMTESARAQIEDVWQYQMSTLDRWLTAINVRHDEHGLPRPSSDERLGRVMKGLRRERGTRQRRMQPLLIDDLRHILSHLDYTSWPHGLAATRDAAVLLIGFSGAFRRSELASLPLGSIRVSRAEGLEALLERSKTDQEGQGQVKALPYGRDALLCPPCVLWRWIRLTLLADTDPTRGELMRHLLEASPRDQHICRDDQPDLFGDERPVFRAITKGGQIGATAISGHSVNAIIKRRAAEVGFNPTRYGGHSLRSGFVTEAFRHGQDGHAIRRQTGHKGDQVLEVYFRENAPFVNNAVTKLGL